MTAGWLLRVDRNRARPGRPAAIPSRRLVLLPHAGGWSSAFRTWFAAVPGDVEVLVAQLPGRGPRAGEPPVNRVEPIAGAIAEELGHRPALPTAVVGHSFGAVVGYELTRTLERAGRAPELLVVSARQPPCFASRPPFAHQASDEDLAAHVRRIGGVSAQLHDRPEVLAAALGAIRADLEALETYRRPPDGTAVPIVALAAVDDPVVVAERMPLWSVETAGAFEHRTFRGGHFYLYDASVAAELCGELLSRLAGDRRDAVLAESA